MADFRAAAQMWGLSGGLLAFDYGSATIRFAAGVEEGEAKTILAELQR